MLEENVSDELSFGTVVSGQNGVGQLHCVVAALLKTKEYFVSLASNGRTCVHCRLR